MCFILTIAIRGNIEVQTGYNIHSYHQTRASENDVLHDVLTRLLKYEDSPDSAEGYPPPPPPPKKDGGGSNFIILFVAE